jgi:hypothetical protein
MGTVCCTDNDRISYDKTAHPVTSGEGSNENKLTPVRNNLYKDEFEGRSTHSISICNSSERSSSMSAFNDLREENATTVSIIRKDKITPNSFITYFKGEAALQAIYIT